MAAISSLVDLTYDPQPGIVYRIEKKSSFQNCIFALLLLIVTLPGYRISIIDRLRGVIAFTHTHARHTPSDGRDEFLIRRVQSTSIAKIT